MNMSPLRCSFPRFLNWFHDTGPTFGYVTGYVDQEQALTGHTQAGIEQLFNQLLRPKLRTLINDIYRDVSYVLDDEGYAQAEYHDVVLKRFVKAWEGLVNGYKVCGPLLHLSHYANTGTGYIHRSQLPAILQLGFRPAASPVGEVGNE